MARVTRIGENLYEVTGFVQSMPHLCYQVIFEKNTPRVVMREGCSLDTWDRHAVQALQYALITAEVE